MVLELSLARLKAFAEFLFRMGVSQGVPSTLAFIAFELPPNGAIGTRILEFLFCSRSDMVLYVIGWELRASIGNLASFRCLKSVEQFSFILIRLWIPLHTVCNTLIFSFDCNKIIFCFRCAFKLCRLTMMISITSRYSPPGPPVIYGNFRV
ncbi:hypothetical protein HanRHA438_Chr15g0717961 [Helianthus annuus]|nr:hypothetical protein HanRHA438_Chr15g0717961 [Helianthus annuus]